MKSIVLVVKHKETCKRMDEHDNLPRLVLDMGELRAIVSIITGYIQQSERLMNTFSRSKQSHENQRIQLLSHVKENLVTQIASENVDILFNMEELKALIHAVKTYRHFVIKTIPRSADREKVLNWVKNLLQQLQSVLEMLKT